MQHRILEFTPVFYFLPFLNAGNSVLVHGTTNVSELFPGDYNGPCGRSAWKCIISTTFSFVTLSHGHVWTLVKPLGVPI